MVRDACDWSVTNRSVNRCRMKSWTSRNLCAASNVSGSFSLIHKIFGSEKYGLILSPVRL